MKTLFITIAFLGLSFGLNAQSIIDKLFDKYSGTKGYTSVYISKYMFDMFRSEESPGQKGEEELNQIISKLSGIKILVTDDDPSTLAPVSLYNEIMKVIPSSPYKEIMTIKENNQNIKFFVKENGARVAELLMVIGGADENVLISIQGDIDMKNISKLAKSMNIEGMENLEKIDK